MFKKTRIINHPTSSSAVYEFIAHIIKDENEAHNVFDSVESEDVLLLQRSIDVNSFQPFFLLAIRNKQYEERPLNPEYPLMFYTVSVDLLSKTKLDLSTKVIGK